MKGGEIVAPIPHTRINTVREHLDNIRAECDAVDDLLSEEEVDTTHADAEEFALAEDGDSLDDDDES